MASMFDIDELALVQEWMGQPALYNRQSRKYAKARLLQAEAKAELDLVRAKLDLAIRQNPDDYNLDRVTEGSVAATILMQKKYKTALKNLNDATYAVNLLQGVVESLDQRKKALENLVRLHGQNYFATPHAEGVGLEVVEELKKVTARSRGKRPRLKHTKED